MGKHIVLAKLLKQPGFRFVGRQFCRSQEENTSASYDKTRKIYHALYDGNPKEDDPKTIQMSIRVAVSHLFRVCLEKGQLFRTAVLDSDTILQMVIDEWKPQAGLEPSDAHLILESYITARERYSGHETSLMSDLVDEFATIWRELYSQQEQEAVDGTSSAAATTPSVVTTAPSVAATTPSVAPTDISQSWPPADFAPEERRLLSDTRIRHHLEGVDNSNAKALETVTTKSGLLDVQTYLSILALSHFPKSHRFGLYLRPIAYVNYKAKQYASDSVFCTIGGFINYAKDMLHLYDRTMAIGLVCFHNRRCPRVVVIHRMRMLDSKYLESDLRFLCFDPMDEMTNSLGTALIDKVVEAFGNNIKEAWWGDWKAIGVDCNRDLIEWALSWISSIVRDEFELPQFSMENKGYTNFIKSFNSS